MKINILAAALLGISLATVSPLSIAADLQKTVAQAWKTYRDIEHGFEVSYPGNGQIVKKTTTYVRIQNYELDYSDGLKPGQFYLEFHFYELPSDCTGWTPAMKRKLISKTPVFIEHLPDEGDAGGDSFVLCAVRRNHVFSVAATENNKRGPIASKIIRTVKFAE